MGRAIRTRRYRLVEWRRHTTDQLTGRELYDHDHDPHETTNLAERPEYQAPIESLSRRLRNSAKWR